jgi:ammonium transporter, Amt family
MNRKFLPLAILAALAAICLFIPDIAPRATGGPADLGDTAWMLTASGLVLLMTPGLAFFYAGMVTTKNVISTMLQSFIALGVITLVWVVVGFSLAFGDSWYGLIGDPRTYFMFRGVGAATEPALAPTIPFVLFAMFQLKFAVITPALITGSFAERVRFSAYLVFMVIFCLLIYCPLAHWTWHPDGFLRKWGVLDFAGGTVVHMSAGLAALAGAMVLGRRQSHEDGHTHYASNIPYVLLGTGMLWFGWFGFNAGSALSANAIAAMAFATTHAASATAMLTWILFDVARGRRPSAMGTCIGAVVGLVAITPAAGFVSIPHGIFIGFVASIVSNIAVHWKSRSTLDDTLDVFPCHGVGGIVGMILTGVLAKDVGLWWGPTTTFLNHMTALVIVSMFSFTGSYVIFAMIDRVLPLRFTPEQELVGLDISQHGEFLELDPARQFRV